MKALESLFIELVSAHLSKFKCVSSSMINNTVQHFAGMKPFNTISIDVWVSLYSANGIDSTN